MGGAGVGRLYSPALARFPNLQIRWSKIREIRKSAGSMWRNANLFNLVKGHSYCCGHYGTILKNPTELFLSCGF